jgi:carbamoylphosphate synthase large subunit
MCAKKDFDELLTRGIKSITIMILIDKALMGWKNMLELLRDKNDNVVIICSIENIWINSYGDSITVACDFV